jgi:Rrf2 family protein
VIEMLYSKTAKYAVLALAEIARRSPETAVPTRTIAESAAIPYPLLAKILLGLKEQGLVVAQRGKHGGIRLARPASEIAVRDVVAAVDGPGILSDCPLYLDACTCERECSFHPIWKPARDALVRFVEETSVQDVADARAKLGRPSEKSSAS